MRVRLKGVNRSVKRLADGTVATYWYAWRGGPRLHGQPGDPEFMAAYNSAIATKMAPTPGVLRAVLAAYQRSSEFAGLAPRTRQDYARFIAVIEREFGDFPLGALADPSARHVFLEWRDKIGLTSARQADYTWQVLKLVLTWGKDRGLVTYNPCERGGKLYHGTRVDKIWSLDDEALFLARAPAWFHLPLLMGLWTGQRQGDLIRLPWSGYDGKHIRLKQRKTGTNVQIPVGGPLKAALDATRKVGPIILVNSHGRPWLSDSFSRMFHEACVKAGVTGLTFHDLRGTAVTRLSLAGCTVPEIVSITGHSLRDVGKILDAHYLHRDPALAAAAIRKLEANIRGTILQTELQTGSKS
jgi:integrase